MSTQDVRMSAAEVLAQAHYRILGSSTDARVNPGDSLLDALKAAGYEVLQVAAECAHCNEPIKYEPDFKLWFHPSSGIEHCYRAPEHTEVATPKHVAADVAEADQ